MLELEAVKSPYLRKEALLTPPRSHPSAEPPLFHDSTPQARAQLARAAARTVEGINRWASGPGPRRAADPALLAEAIEGLDPCPPRGVDLDEVLAQVNEIVLSNGVRPADPRCAAHLHSPTLLTAAAAELAIGVTNQSMDSFDQAPAATLLEDHLVRWLATQLGLPSVASGVLTAGGTASNLLGLFLAREHSATWAADNHEGNPGDRQRRTPVILCSRAAHFSIQQAAVVLGLGRDSVVPVATDHRDRIDLVALDRTTAELPAGVDVLALVGTAGTTDAGAIDPLGELAERAAELGAWFHVDAAVGGAFCLSDRLAERLSGIERADSIIVDLHKLWWQPIGASALLVRDATYLDKARHPSDYLDRTDDPPGAGNDGWLNLVSRSLDTSRRFDALKIVVSLRATGRQRMAAMLEHLVDTAAETADYIDSHPELELLCPPSTITVLFRWRPSAASGARPTDELLDQVNIATQRKLFRTGQAVIGRTKTSGGAAALKLTMVNPLATTEDFVQLVDEVAAEAAVQLTEAPSPAQVRPDSPRRTEACRKPAPST